MYMVLYYSLYLSECLGIFMMEREKTQNMVLVFLRGGDVFQELSLMEEKEVKR